MKKIILITLLLGLTACSSTPEKSTSPELETTQTTEEVLQKATSPGAGTRLRSTVTPLAEKKSAPKEDDNLTQNGMPCQSPLGEIPHGGKATGFVEGKVPADGVCIRDTLSCNNGVWTGQAIHPKCVKEKATATP